MNPVCLRSRFVVLRSQRGRAPDVTRPQCRRTRRGGTGSKPQPRRLSVALSVPAVISRPEDRGTRHLARSANKLPGMVPPHVPQVRRLISVRSEVQLLPGPSDRKSLPRLWPPARAGFLVPIQRRGWRSSRGPGEEIVIRMTDTPVNPAEHVFLRDFDSCART